MDTKKKRTYVKSFETKKIGKPNETRDDNQMYSDSKLTVNKLK